MAIVFDIRGPMGFFRKPYTTTSSVSFPLPPPSAIAGLIASILGIPNGAETSGGAALYWDRLQGTRIAIQRINPNAWFSATTNFWNTKNPQKNAHIQIKHQFIKNPHFRISVQGGVEKELQQALENKQFHYPPNLGTAYTLADIYFIGFFDFDKSKIPAGEKGVSICSATPINDEVSSFIDFIQSKGLMKDTFPFRLDKARALKETIDLIYPSTPDGRIVIDTWDGLDVTCFEEEHIAWLPAW